MSCCDSISAFAPVASYGMKPFDDNRSVLFIFSGILGVLGWILSIVSLAGASTDEDAIKNASWYTYSVTGSDT